MRVLSAEPRDLGDLDENETISKAQAQVFVTHTGSAMVKRGKIFENR